MNQPKTVCDTNIWRSFAHNEISEQELLSVTSPLTATFINIDEIAKSNLILSNVVLARTVIKILMKKPGNIIFLPPLIHLKKLDTPNYIYDIKQHHSDILEITTQIANGSDVNQTKMQEYITKRKEQIQAFCDMTNEMSVLIKKNIKNTKEHRLHNTILGNRELISYMVKIQTGEYLSTEFDWEKIELFENVLKDYFIDLEITGMKMKPNDFYDLFTLLYVQPNDKIWTKDVNKGPLNYIKKTKMDKYLFNIA